jgi:peptide/nickel transport system permease protein
VILLETALSFLGLGIQPPLSSLGTMLSYGRSSLLSGVFRTNRVEVPEE